MDILGPFEPTGPWQATSEYMPHGDIVPSYPDGATIYLDITVSGTDIYEPGCLIIGDGEAELRWTWEDDYLRWIGADANSRWDAQFRLGTAQC